MQRFADWFRDSEGRGYPGATVTVYNAGLSTLPQLYNPGGSITAPAPISNPFTTDPNGYYAFAVPNGVYDIHLQGGGMPETIIQNVNISEPIISIGTFANPLTTLGDIIYGGASGIPTRLSGNTIITKKYLQSVGNGSIALAPSFQGIIASDVASTPAGGISSSDVQSALNELDSKKAVDILSLHLAGSENITGVKTFSSQPLGINASSIVNIPSGIIGSTNTQSAVNEIITDLADFTSASLGSALSGFAYSLAYGANTVGKAVKDVMDRTTAIESLDILYNVLAANAQCRLYYTDATHLTLSPYNGNKILINGTVCTIPSAGVVLAATGLLATTLYYVYAYMNGATMTLEAITTAHSPSAVNGTEIKNGDATRTLVGMAYVKTAATFADSGTQRFVASWFNPRPRGVQRNFTALRSVSTVGTWSEFNSEVRVEFLAWGDRDISFNGFGTIYSSGAYNMLVGLGLDASNALAGPWQAITVSGIGVPFGGGFTQTVGEGYHWLTLVGQVQSAGTGNAAQVSGISASIII